MPLNDIINAVRKNCHLPNSAKEVVANLMFGRNWDDIVNDEDSHRLVMRAGLNSLVRVFLKNSDDDADEDDDDSKTEDQQLNFWPMESQRQLVKAIGEKRVFVPSRRSFVALRPDQISPPECVEAGNYLKNHAEWVSTRGDLLIELGRTGWK